MKRIDSIEDEMNDVVTYALDDGRMARFSIKVIREYGVTEVLRQAGVILPDIRIPIMQNGECIGSVSPDFDPLFIKSSSPWYQPRQGDFTRAGDKWVASRSLGSGDLEAIPGFQWGQ